MMDSQQLIQAFLDGDPFAVAGASTSRAKYGNKVLRCYLQNDRRAIPLHRNEAAVEGQAAYRSLDAIPEAIHGLSIITPPAVTETIVDDAIAAGIQHLWMQPGAESEAAIRRAEAAGIGVIHGGPCLLVVLGFTDAD